MKIGILTFHNAHNYGAVLQAYALKKTLQKLGNDVFIINYKNKAIKEHYPMVLEDKDEISNTKWKMQYVKFEEFITTYLLENSKIEYSASDVEKLSLDAFIVGSDQVWERWLTGGWDNVYFLGFKTNAKKISYAASKTYAEISVEECEWFKKYLGDFDAISVREESLAQSLKKCGINAYSMPDPTLLLNGDDYAELVKSKKSYGRYILVYYVVEDEVLNKCAEYLAEKTNMPIMEIHYYWKKNFNNLQLADCGPEDFLSLFKNAEYALTNSFHGVVFSIINRKNFWAIYEKDSRKDALLNKIGLQHRHIYTIEEISNEIIDYRNAEIKLNLIKKEAVEYLKTALM